MTTPHAYPEPTLLDACEARYGPIDWDAIKSEPFDASDELAKRDDRAWSSGSDADRAAGRHFPNDGKGAPE
jgi:hypothetical protein